MAVRDAAGGKVAVIDVMAGSPPALAGIEAGDIIVRVDDIPVESVDDLAELITVHQTGETALFSIVRDRETIATEVVMAPCEPVPTAAAPATGVPGDVLDDLAGQIRALKAQVEELSRTVEALGATVETLRQAP
jgi:C-terminal processing protease CtpA/Prc